MWRGLGILLLLFYAVSGEGETTNVSGGVAEDTTGSETAHLPESISESTTIEAVINQNSTHSEVTTSPASEPTVTEEAKSIGDGEIPTTTTDPPPTTTEQPGTPPSIATSTTEEQMEFINILDIDSESDATTTVPPTTTEFIETTTLDEKTRRERLSDQIRAVIKHYKEFGTVTVPDANIPDPMNVPNINKNIGGNEVTFTNTKVYGLSNFTVEHVNTDLEKMQVYVGVYIKRLVILGNYTAKIFFRKVAGPFNATLLYVEASGAAALTKDSEGNVQASESEMDMTFMDSRVKFDNMGLMGTLLQGAVASAGPVLFESIKPFVLTEINNKVRDDVNKKIKSIGSKFLESGTKPPIDVAIEEGKKYVQENGYDPYYIKSKAWEYMPKHLNNSLIKVNISRLSLTGLSNFRRVGEVSLSMESGTIQMGLHLATSKLKGRCTWFVGIGTFGRQGHTNFTVDYVQGRGLVNQSLDVSRHPVLDDLDINVGKVRIQLKGTGAFDFILEAVVNTLPDLIRHITVDAIELPLKHALQRILSEINVEELLDKHLPELDKMGV